ncbi:MAG TPA: hypothetical protein VFU47_11675 [Armatimonadota bacterium]|nr:hypothetical protein [Armatimonadota bacterium]
MQEDFAGTLTSGTGRTYATCAECGQVFRRDDARPEPAGLNDGAHSEFTELCPDCEKLDRMGETPLLSDADEGTR